MKIYLLYLGPADDPLADISEVLNTDDDILGIISDDLAKSVDHSGTFAQCLFYDVSERCVCVCVCVCEASVVIAMEKKVFFFLWHCQTHHYI